jgi:hypothetical protein
LDSDSHPGAELFENLAVIRSFSTFLLDEKFSHNFLVHSKALA